MLDRYADVPALCTAFRIFFSGGGGGIFSLKSSSAGRFFDFFDFLGPFDLDGQIVPECLGHPLGFTWGLVFILVLSTDSCSLSSTASFCNQDNTHT